MVKVSLERTVRIPKEKIYSALSEFETLPDRFPDMYKSLKVVERPEKDMVIVEEDLEIAGRRIHQKTRHTLLQGNGIKSQVLEGDTKGTVIEIMLKQNDDPASTDITINADLQLGKLGKVLGIFAKGKIKQGLEKVIEGLESGQTSRPT